MAATPLHSQRYDLLVCTVLLLLMSCLSVGAQLDVIAITPSPNTGSADTPNTVLGTVGSQIASTLLPAGTEALLWGAVPSSAVITACELLLNTGKHIFTANISNDWGGSEYLTLQVRATGGCLAESDGSGTQFAFVDNHGRYSAVVCPLIEAGSIGCGVYLTGDDIDALYDSWYSHSNLSPLLHETAAVAASRSITGSSRSMLGKDDPFITKVTGVMTAESCAELTPLADFCVPGELGVSRHCSCPGGSCCNPTCFPGDALVRTPRGVIPMSQLQLGDQVAVWGTDGVVIYDDVYAFGHKDPSAIAFFIEITVEPATTMHTTTDGSSPHHPYSNNTDRTIRLSALHFLPTSTSSAINAALLYKRAKDVQVGDFLWVTYHSTSGCNDFDDGPHVKKHVLLSRVKGISTTLGHGLYNPLTLSGTIIVDDVVASAHSEWFLDSVFDMVDLSHWLPTAYQWVLAPVCGLYRMLGKKAYISLYEKLDANLEIPKFGTNYGGTIVLGACASLLTAISTPLFMRLVVHSQKP